MIIESVSKPKEGINPTEKFICFVYQAEGFVCTAEKFLNSEQLVMGIVICGKLCVPSLVFLKITAFFCG